MNNTLKLVDNRKKIDILDENDNILTTAIFDPEDNYTYQKLLEIIDVLTNGARKEKNISIDIKTIDTKKLETLEDFEKINKQFSSLRDTFNLREEIITEVMQKTDDIFGQGISKIVMLNGKNVNNLLPLLKNAMLFVDKVRETKKQPYKKTNKSSVIK